LQVEDQVINKQNFENSSNNSKTESYDAYASATNSFVQTNQEMHKNVDGEVFMV